MSQRLAFEFQNNCSSSHQPPDHTSLFTQNTYIVQTLRRNDHLNISGYFSLGPFSFPVASVVHSTSPVRYFLFAFQYLILYPHPRASCIQNQNEFKNCATERSYENKTKLQTKQKKQKQKQKISKIDLVNRNLYQPNKQIQLYKNEITYKMLRSFLRNKIFTVRLCPNVTESS